MKILIYPLLGKMHWEQVLRLKNSKVGDSQLKYQLRAYYFDVVDKIPLYELKLLDFIAFAVGL